MLDAYGRPQTIAVLGGTSEIAEAIVAALAVGRSLSVVLAGRDPAALQATGARLGELGVTVAAPVLFDAVETEAASTVERCFAAFDGSVDMVIVAVGLLGESDPPGTDPGEAERMFTVNTTWPAAACSAAAARMRPQGAGRLVVLSTVAGVRVRRSNFLYGAAKAGLDAFAVGLGEALRGSGVVVHVVRPGFVHTKMTAGREVAPMAVGPGEVAEAVVAGLRQRRAVIWAPARLGPVFLALRNLPQSLWRRLPG